MDAARSKRRLVTLLAAILAACGGDGGDDTGGDVDGAAGDGGEGDALAEDGGVDGAGGDGGVARTILFQCHPFDGGLCEMDADGSDRRTIQAAGFVPHGVGDGSMLFHTSAYRVNRRTSAGMVQDLGDGAFARPHPDGRILFQCSGLGGGICVMNGDGGDRSTVRASGRVPDIDATGRILFHTDAYRVLRRDPGGGENDLGAGAFASWASDGRIVFQCSGLDGGLCRMNADGTGRETISAAGRVPDPEGTASGRVVFHSDSYQVMVGPASLGAGANAEWW